MRDMPTGRGPVMNLAEQYRPSTFAEVVGQDRAIAEIQAVSKRGWGGRAWWITGASGTGKSTLARIVATEGADPFNVEEIDAGALTPAALHDLEESMRFRGFGAKPGKAYIVNEAHGLRRDTIRLLLVVLERLPAHCCFIFTTTKAGQESLFEDDVSGDASPLLSRCTEITLDNGDATQLAFAKRALEIARREGCDGLPLCVYKSAVAKAKGNMRAVLQRVESGAFKADAKEVIERELSLIKATKGPAAEQRRAELTAALAACG